MNNMTLREAYACVGKQLLEQRANEFITDVEVTVSVDGKHESGDPIYEVDGDALRVMYNIDLEYRSYGIKDITATNFRIFPFQLRNMNLEDPEIVFTQENIIEAGNMQIRHDEPSQYFSFYPKSIELHVDKDGKVIVENSIIYF
jgi:hypothetical protein